MLLASLHFSVSGGEIHLKILLKTNSCLFIQFGPLLVEHILCIILLKGPLNELILNILVLKAKILI